MAERRRRVHPPAAVVSGLAVAVVWLALVVPDRLDGAGPAVLVRIPLEGLALVAVLLAVRPTLARPVAVAAGLVLAALTLLRAVDLGVRAAFERPFDPLTDPGHLGSAVGLLGDSLGRPSAVALTVGAVLGIVLVAVGVTSSVVRTSSLVVRHRRGAAAAAAALGVAWAGLAVTGLQVAPGERVAATAVVGLVADQAEGIRDEVRDRESFAAALAHDPVAAASGASAAALPGLRGKDVLVVFVESYGRVALDDPSIEATVGPTLDRGAADLGAAGFSARSGWLTSPTFGGLSWLAHSTLQSGLRVGSQGRYDRLVASDRRPLTAMFGAAGWRTVCDDPANHGPWGVARTFYRCDRVYDAENTGYRGPAFGYAPVPDQYTLQAFRRAELRPGPRDPVMAQISLVSSHAPWSPLPQLVDPARLGDGSVFDGMPERATPSDVVWRSPGGVRAAYAQSVAYSLASLVEFVTAAADDDLVLLVLGDHQPSAPVTRPGASHDVPVSLIARDPSVLDVAAGWGWSPGLRPAPGAPVWPMEDVRGRLVSAFGPSGGEPAVLAARGDR